VLGVRLVKPTTSPPAKANANGNARTTLNATHIL
jgi:hypothetical protein